MAKYQRDRQDTELEKVFEEKLTPGGTESEVWRTAEVGDDERVKIREHKVSVTELVVSFVVVVKLCQLKGLRRW